MKIMSTAVRTWLTAAGVLLLGGFAAPSFAYSVVPDFNISDPDVPDAGFPHVENSSVKVKFQRNGASGWKLTAANNASSTFKVQVNPATAHDVTGGGKSFQLTSFFNNALNFTTGSMLIKGKVPGLGINSSQTLWSASLSDFGFDFNPNDGSPVSLGWKTNQPFGPLNELYNLSGSAESVYLYDFNPSSLAFGPFSINAKAITTVPIPAAVWLLGSALASLAGMRRKAPAFA